MSTQPATAPPEVAREQIRATVPDIPPPTKQLGMKLETMEDFWRFAGCIIKSGWGPKGMTCEGAVVAIQYGAELGLDPVQAIQNIAVINGRPTLWGDAVLALCMKRRTLFDQSVFEEGFEGDGDSLTAYCIAGRIGGNPRRETFSVADAKRANLWGKGTYESYPRRMLQMRARSFALRNTFPDVLKGLYSTEEMAVDEVLDKLDLQEDGERQPFDPDAMRAAVTKEPDPDLPPPDQAAPISPPAVPPKPRARRPSTKQIDETRAKVIELFGTLPSTKQNELRGEWGYPIDVPIEVLHSPQETLATLRAKLKQVEVLAGAPAEAPPDDKLEDAKARGLLRSKLSQAFGELSGEQQRAVIGSYENLVTLADTYEWPLRDLQDLRGKIVEAAKATV